MSDVRGILSRGRITKEPFENNKGNWEAVFKGYAAGRTIGVVTAIEEVSPGEQVVIITTYEVDKTIFEN